MSITKHQKYCVCIFIAAAFLLLWQLDYASLWNPDEGRYAAAALEMVQPLRGEKTSWLIPHLNTLPRLNKPPLVYWMTAISYQVLGTNTWSSRLPSAISSIGVLALLWWMAVAVWGQEKGRKRAFFAMLIWVTSLLPFILSRLLNTDLLLTFATTLVLISIWRTTEDKPPWSAFAACAIGLGLALLAKGPVGVALPLMVVFVWLILAYQKYFYRYFVEHKFAILLTFAAGIALASPWYLAVNQARPGFLAHFILNENLGRFSGDDQFHAPTSMFYYLPVLLLGLFPWTFFLIPAAAGYWKERFAATMQSRARLFLWVWGTLIIVFFSASSTKLITYILPAFPAFALLLGDSLAEYQLPAKLWRIAMTISAAIMMIAGSLLLTLPYLGVLKKVAPVALWQTIFMFSGGILLTAALAMLVLTRFPRLQVAVQSAAALLFVAMLPFCVSPFAPYEDISRLMQKLTPKLLPDARIVQFQSFQPTAIFYTHRPVTAINQPNSSGYNSREYKESPLFLSDANSIDILLSQPRQTFVLVRWRNMNILKKKQLHYWGGNNDYALLSNRPAPTGWPIEYIAPTHRFSKMRPASDAQ